MPALVVSRRSSERSQSPLDRPYTPESWQPEDGSAAAESPRAPSASPLLQVGLFCGDIWFPVTEEVLLSISLKLHGLVFTATDTSCERIGYYDLDDELLDVSCFLEAGLRSFKERTAPYHGLPTIREESTFEEVSAIIHLSRKYESAHLYRSAVAWLKRHFTPDTEMRTPPGFLDAGAIGVLNLARLIDSRSLLPGAIFACCRLTVQGLANGYPRDDRGKETLSLEDIVRVRVTRDRLIGACIVSATCVYRSKRAPTCRRTRCRDVLDRIRQTTAFALQAVRPSQPVRFPILQGRAPESADGGLCDGCAKMVEARECEAREEIWGLLPCIMDEVVPGWAGMCARHCPTPKPVEQLSDSDPDDWKDCYMDGPVHDWMRYRRSRWGLLQ